jgi:hypothetical protein
MRLPHLECVFQFCVILERSEESRVIFFESNTMKLSILLLVGFVLIAGVTRPLTLRATENQEPVPQRTSENQNNPSQPQSMHPHQPTAQATTEHRDANTYNYYGRFRYIPPRVVVPESRLSTGSTVLVAVFTFFLVVATLLQAFVLQETFISEHRPSVGIRRIAILNIPEEINEQNPPIEVHLRLINRGGSAAKIIEGNVTFSVDKRPSRQAILRREDVSPPFDIRKGMPAYSPDQSAAQNAIIRPAETYNLIATKPRTNSIQESTELYLALHLQKDDLSLAFHVFGYFKYRTCGWIGIRRVYYTAFCRRFVPPDATFVPINDGDYEYQD